MSKPISIQRLTPELFNEFISLWHFHAHAVHPHIFQEYKDKSLFSYIFLEDSKPIGAFGIIVLWDGVCEAWFLSTPVIEERPLFLVKTFRKFTDELLNKGMHRVQMVVEDNYGLNRWAETLGFEKEGVLRRHGLKGQDNVMYAKVWE